LVNFAKIKQLNSKHAPSTFNEEQLKILSLLVKQPNSKLMSEQNSKVPKVSFIFQNLKS